MINLDVLLGSDRTEDLNGDQVVQLFAATPSDAAILKSLMSPGTHLLEGSRGTGKTMLLRVAFENLRAEGGRLPIFVSFSHYLATYNPNSAPNEGYSPFQSWVFAKLVRALWASVGAERRNSSTDQSVGSIDLDKYIAQLEKHYNDPEVGDPSYNAAALGVTELELLDFARLDHLQERFLSILDMGGIPAAVLLLDEAAQSFAEDLQPEFFQLIRHLRHSRIAIKAAVYPHTTNYGPNFDVGHDAQILRIERQIETEEGVAFFSDFIEKRYSQAPLGAALRASGAITSFLIKSSGGNPRWFIHLLNQLNHHTDGPIQAAAAISVAKELPDTTLWPYLRNLRERLRSKRSYFDSALELAQVFITDLRDMNALLKRDSKARPVCYVAVSLHKTVPFRVQAALKLLQYAGIIYPRGPKRISERENAEMYLLHPAIQVRENTLYGSEANPSVEAIVDALTDPLREKFRSYTKRSPRLVGFRQDEEEGGNCWKCGTVLPSDARFCPKCGAQILQASPYQELLSAPSSALELTPGIKARLVEDGRFPTVESVIKAAEEDLDSIHMIGPQRVLIIRFAAEEFLAG